MALRPPPSGPPGPSTLLPPHASGWGQSGSLCIGDSEGRNPAAIASISASARPRHQDTIRGSGTLDARASIRGEILWAIRRSTIGGICGSHAAASGAPGTASARAEARRDDGNVTPLHTRDRCEGLHPTRADTRRRSRPAVAMARRRRTFGFMGQRCTIPRTQGKGAHARVRPPDTVRSALARGARCGVGCPHRE